MNMMFSSVIATGHYACTPNSRNQPRESIDERELLAGKQDDIEVSGVPAPPEATTSRKRKKEKKKSISLVLKDLAESCKTISRWIQEQSKLSNPFSIAQTLEKLSTYPEVHADEDFYDFSITYLMEKRHREIFMCLPEKMNIKWLQNRYTHGT